jgi:hypothetical protein
MRVSPGNVLNVAAWAVLLGLIAAASAAVIVLGPLGLVILGLATLLICTRLELNDEVPTWSVAVLTTRLGGTDSPEQRAASLAERRERLSPLRFGRLCGLVLLVAGAAGFIWQLAR